MNRLPGRARDLPIRCISWRAGMDAGGSGAGAATVYRKPAGWRRGPCGSSWQSAESRGSSSGRRLVLLAARSPGVLVQGGDELRVAVKGAEAFTLLVFLLALRDAAINASALRRRVLVVGIRELRAVDHRSWRDDNLAALKSEVHRVACG